MGWRTPDVIVNCNGGGGKYVGRWLPDEKGPEGGDHNPELPSCSDDSLLFGD